MANEYLPQLSEFDPKETSEGTIDPLGLYSIADALGTKLAPGIRERQDHPRFLTAVAAGLVICARFPEQTIAKDEVSEPWQVFEWFVVEGLVRAAETSKEKIGIPGRGKVEDAIKDKVHLTAKRYLKTPGTFGFHGVYRALAKELGVDQGGQLGEFGARLLTAWQDEQGLNGFLTGNQGRGKTLKDELSSAIEDGLKSGAATRSSGWAGWHSIRSYFSPYSFGKKEANVMSAALTSSEADFRRQLLGFIASTDGQRVWRKDQSERQLHRALRAKASADLKRLIDAIDVFEEFSRLLQDAFDDCLVEMTLKKARTSIKEMASLEGVTKAQKNVSGKFSQISDKLLPLSLSEQFERTFASFARKQSAEEWVETLFEHHKTIQSQKPPNGKLPWCEKVDTSSFIVRPNYRSEERPRFDDSYLHGFRGFSLWSFAKDLRLVR